MSWTYDSNIMGPSGLWWYEKNNVPYTEEWYGGRIDCYCNDVHDIDYSRYNREIELPIMDGDSLSRLDAYLDELVTEKLIIWEELLEMYERDTGLKLKMFEERVDATAS